MFSSARRNPSRIIILSVSFAALAIGAAWFSRVHHAAAAPPAPDSLISTAPLPQLPCPGCLDLYQGPIKDLHFHLPLATCVPTQPYPECDVPLQRFFAQKLTESLTGEMDRLGVTRVLLLAAANDNRDELFNPPVSAYDAVFDPARDGERSTVAADSPQKLAKALGVRLTDPDPGGYVKGMLAADPTWEAVGEIHLQSKAYDRNDHADDPKLNDPGGVYDEAAKKNIPVLIHDDPRHGLGNTLSSTAADIRKALEDHAPAGGTPGLTLLWAHIGHHVCISLNECGEPCSPNPADVAVCVKTLLDDFQPSDPATANLYLVWEFDTLSNFIDPATSQTTPLFQFMKKHSDQILIGSDIGVRKPVAVGTCDTTVPPPPPSWRYAVELNKSTYWVQSICYARLVLSKLTAGEAADIGYQNANALGF